MWRNDHQQQHNVSAFWFCFCLHLVDHLFVRGGAPADERQGRRLKGGGGGWVGVLPVVSMGSPAHWPCHRGSGTQFGRTPRWRGPPWTGETRRLATVCKKQIKKVIKKGT